MSAAKKLRPLMSGDNTEWGTPSDFFMWIHASMLFTVDVCATHDNAKLGRFWDKAQNGLAQRWDGETFWMNSEFGDALPIWTGKARHSVVYAQRPTAGAVLAPSRVDTGWWRDLTRKNDAGRLRRSFYVPESQVWWTQYARLTVGIYHHEGRLQFEGFDSKGESSPFPTSIVILASPKWRPPKPGRRAWEIGPPLTLGMPT